MKKYLGKIKYVILTTLIVLFLFTTVAYSGLASKLAITSEVMFRALADIRVTNIKLEKTTGNALESYEPKYNVDATTTGFELPSADSSITYRVTVTNRGKRNQTIYEFIKNSINADGVNIKIEGYTEKDIIPYESSIDFLITFTTTNPSNQTINVIEKYDFREVYTIEYDANGGTNAPKEQIKYQKEDIALREEIPTRETYKFVGWSETQGSETAEYKAGGAYTLDKDVILYAVWQKNAAKLDLNYNVDGTWYYSGYNNRILTGIKVNGEDQGYLNDFGQTYDYGTSYEIYGFKLDGEEIPYSKKYTVDGTNHLGIYFNTMNFTVNDESLGSISHEQLIVIPGITYKVTNSTITMSDGRIVTSSPKTVTGYTTKFTGYTITPNSTTINAKTTVKANFTKEANTYKITFDNKSATTAGTTSIYEKYNTGIYLDSDLKTAMTTTTNSITKPTRSYTVSFNANNTGITMPSAITKSYSYSGHYTDAVSGTQMINENGYITNSFKNTSYTANATLYAHWKAKPSVTIPSISKTGYTCSWNTSADGKGTTYNGGDVTDKLNTQTLYAVCAANTYTVTYNSNGGSGTMTNDTATYNSNYITKKNTFIKTGYTFNGWNEKADGTGTVWGLTTSGVYESGKSWKWTYTKNITLYAQWKANTNTKYVVKHYKQKLDGTYPSEADDTDELTGTTDSSMSPAVKSYAGFTSPSVQTVTIAADGSTVVTYKYARNKYIFTLGSTTGITTTGSTASGSYYYGSTITLKATESAGYTFNGWTSSNTNLVANQTNASATFTMPAGNITMTPSVNLASYTVTYDATTNGGSTAKQTISTKYKSLVDLTKKAEKTGYEFVGWNTNKDATSALSSYEMPANDVTLYAIYSKTLTATFNYYNSKSEIRSITIYNNATSGSITSPAALGTPSGYTFRHYSTSNAANASKTIDANSAIVLTSNQTYYASYQKTVTLNFYYHSGTDTYANTQTSTTASGIQYLGYNNVIINSNVSIPSAVTKSTGYYGTSYKGVTAANTTTPISINTGTTNYYAYYQATITYYYYNGSAHTTGTGTRTAYSNGTNYVTTASAAPTPSSYDGAAFKGWSYTNDSVNDRNPAYTAMTALYAYYQKTVNATFNYYDGSKAASVAAGNTRTYISKSGGVNTLNTNITIPDAAKASRGSYTYRGISTSNAANASAVTPTTANTTYYSSYTYAITVNFTANGGTGTAPSSAAGTGYMNYSGSKIGISVTMPSNTFKKDGYTFGGWNDTVANKTYAAGTSVTIDSSRDFNATWNVVTYTIKYNLNGGTVSTANPTSYKITDADITLNNPTKPGYTFTGWTGTGLSEASTTVTIKSGSYGNREYTANYSINQYYYDVNPDSGIKSFDITIDGKTSTGLTDYYQKLDYGKEATITNVVAKTGYTYTGYKVNGSMTTLTGSTNSNIKTKLGAGNGVIALTSTANALTFNDQTLASIKYSTTPQALVFKGATNGTGDYKYEITDGNANGYFTINGTTITTSDKVVPPVGTYKLTVKATDNTSGVTKNADITIVIEKASSTNPTLTAYSGTYDGQAHTIGVTGGNGGTIQYSTDQKTWSTTKPTRTAQGTTTVYVKVVGDENHTDTIVISSTITINPATITYTASSYEGFYDGNSHTINVSVTKPASGATITYSTSSNGTYSATKPSYTAAGTYTIYFKIAAANYTTKTDSRTVKINPSNLSGSVKITGTNTWGQKLTANVTNTNSASLSYQWYYTTNTTATGGTVIADATSSTYVIDKSLVGKYIYVVVTASKTNYNKATWSDITDATNSTASVAKQALSVTANAATATYDGNAHNATVKVNSASWNGKTIVSGTSTSYGNTVTSAGVTGTTYNLLPSRTAQGTTSISYKITGGSYYNDFKGTSSVTINPSGLSGSVKITGTNTWGQKLTASVTNTNSATLTYQWYYTTNATATGGTAITNATGSTYVVDKSLVGKYIYVVVTASKTNYSNAIWNDITDNATNSTGPVGKQSATISFASSSVTKDYGNSAFINTLTNTGDGTVNYTSSNTNVATINSTTGEVTIKHAGTATITATVTDGTYYKYSTKMISYTLTVKKIINPAKVSPVTGIVYGDSKAMVSATGVQGTIYYSVGTVLTEANYLSVGSQDVPSSYVKDSGYRNAGTYNIYYYVTGNSNYNAAANDSSTPVAVIIGKKQDVVSITEKSAKYTGSAIGANTATATSGTGITYTYYSSQDCSGTALSGAPINKGNYSVKATSAGDSNYTSGSKCVKHTITQGTPTISLGDTTKTYTGSAITSVGAIGKNPNGSSVSLNYTYTYYNGTTCSGTAISAPVNYNANNYSVKATSTATSNLNSATSNCAKLTINKAAGSISYGTKSVIKTYGDAAFTNVLTKTGDGTVKYTSSDTNIATVDGAGKVTIKAATSTAITITATVTDGNNYTYSTKTASYTLNIGKKQDVVSITEKSATYTGSAIGANTATATSGTRITYTYYSSQDCSGTALSGAPINKGNYSVKATSAGDSNYTSGSKCVKHTITQGTPTISLGDTTKTYTGSAITSVGAIGKNPNGSSVSLSYTYTYYNGMTCSGTALSGAPTNANNYSVKATSTATSNLRSATSNCAKLTINKATGSISYATTSITKTYGDGKFTNPLTKTGDGTVKYTSGDTKVATVDSTTGEVTITGAGTTTITATVTDGTNYTYATKTATYTLKVNAKVITITFSLNKASGMTLSGSTSVVTTDQKVTCSITSGSTCAITSPTIKATSTTPTVVGWNTSASGTTSTWNENTSKVVSSNATYYAITKKNAVTLKATASGNWSTLNGTTTPTCTLPEVYNGAKQATSCEVTMPTVTAPSATPTFVGWNQDSNGTTNDSNYNTKTNKLTLTSSNTGKTWYAITRSDAVTFTGKINANNATLSSTNNVSCTIAASYNGSNQAKSCYAKMPTITAPSTTPKVVGWNTDANATTNDSSYSTSTGNLTLTSSNTGKTWYAITKKIAVTLKATANANRSTLNGTTTPTCTLPEVYNGGMQASSCEVTMPTVTAPSATPIFVGWNLSASGTTNDSNYNMTTNKLTLTNSNTGKTWSAITRKDAVTLTGKVNANNATLSSTSNVSCIIAASYNGTNQAKSCYAKMPTVTAPSATPTFVGWNQSANGTTNDSSYSTSTGNLTLTSSNTGKTWYAITKKIAVTLKATANRNWSTLSGSTTPTCTLPEVYNGDTQASSCEVTMPTVTAPSATPIFVGWNLSASGTTNDSNYNMTTNKLTLTNSNTGKTWSAITRKDAVTLTGKVNANNATLSSTSNVSCIIAASYNGSNQAKSCYAKMPTITAPSVTPTVVGWNTDANATTNDSSYSTSTGNITLTSSNTGKTWYAITKKNAVTLKATANTNGSGLSGSTTPTCTIAESYNGIAQATSCEVTMPTVTPHSNTPTFVGWNLSASGTTNDSSYNTTTNKLTLTNSNSGKNWYAITRKDAVTLTVKVDANSGTLSSTSDVGCTIAETYNAMGQATSCYAKMPTGTKTGYSHIGWNTDSTATTSDSNYGTSSGNLKITKDNTGTIWYAIYKAKSYKVTFNPNGGKVSPTYKLVTFDSNYGKDSTLPTPTRADSTDSASGKTISYVFEGWYTAANGGTKVTDETLVNTASDHSIYAHWISKPIITGGSADWFKGHVAIGISTIKESVSDTSDVTYEYYTSTSNESQIGGEWKNNGSANMISLTFSESGVRYIFFRAISSAGVYSDISNYQTLKIDADNPTLSVTGNPTSWVTTDVTLKVSASDSTSGLKNVTVNGKALSLSSGIVNYTVSANGTYTFVATDIAGNTTTQSVVVSKIDKVTPTAPVLTGGSDSDTSSCVTIQIGKAGTTGPSGIQKYEAELENMLNGAYIHRSYNQITYKDNGYWQTTGTDPYVAFDDIGNAYMTHARVSFASPTPVAMNLQVFYWTAGSSPTGANSKTVNVPAGTSGYVDVDIPDGTYDGLRFDFGNTANVTYQFQFWGYVQKYSRPDEQGNYSTVVCNRGLNRVRYRTLANNGLISNWSDYDTNNKSHAFISNESVLDTQSNLRYSTLSKAINVLAGQGGSQHLRLLRDISNESVSIQGYKNYSLNMMGFVIKSSQIVNHGQISLTNGLLNNSASETETIVSYGQLNIQDCTIISKSKAAVSVGDGNVSIEGSKISSTNARALYAGGGTITITNTNISSTNSHAINQKGGTLNYSSGTITVYGDSNGLNQDGGSFVIGNGASITAKNGSAINSTGSITVNQATLTSNANGINMNSGTVTINSGASITSKSSGIRVKGTVNVNGGTITSDGGNGIIGESDGTINIYGGEIIGGFSSGVYSAGSFYMKNGTVRTQSAGKNGVYIYSGTAKMEGGSVLNVVDNNSCSGAFTLASTSTKGFTMSGGIISGCVGINYQSGATGKIAISGSAAVSGAHTGIKINSTTSKILTIGTSGSISTNPKIASEGDYYAVDLGSSSYSFTMYSGQLISSKSGVFRGKRAGSCARGKTWTVTSSKAYCK